jgi:hypothetical protein
MRFRVSLLLIQPGLLARGQGTRPGIFVLEHLRTYAVSLGLLVLLHVRTYTRTYAPARPDQLIKFRFLFLDLLRFNYQRTQLASTLTIPF